VNRRASRWVDRRGKPSEVNGDDRSDEQPEHQEELALLLQVGLTRLVNQLGDLPHRAVHGQSLELSINEHPEEEPERRYENTRQEQCVPVEPKKRHGAEIGQHQVGLAAAVGRRRLGLRGKERGRQERGHPKGQDGERPSGHIHSH
jgi:hypothetical protein